MRPSKKKHPVAVLRTFLGLRQKELADLVGCSVSTIQSIELGRERLGLSEDLALRIVDQTHINLSWLLRGDPQAPPLNEWESPYCKDDYEFAQALLRQRRDPRTLQMLSKLQLAETVASIYKERLVRLIKKALRKGRRGIIDWQIDQALTQIESRYGIVYSQDEKQAFRDPYLPRFPSPPEMRKL